MKPRNFALRTAWSARLGWTSALLVLVASAAVHAFPPAPHHTLYGLIRNQYGEPLDVRNATVFVEVSGRAGVGASITASTDPGVNYVLRVPMDSLTRSDLYQPTALARNQSFRLRVQIGTSNYLPLEMALRSATIGQPGQSTRLDLTLGEDKDGDGLPDAWEQAIIDVFGGTLESITPQGDADGDGVSNYDEYRTGTLPFDPQDGFRVNLVQHDVGDDTLEFLTIRGRTYSLQVSTDLQQWAPVEFKVLTSGIAGPLQSQYTSADLRYLQVQVPRQAGPHRFFRATIQQ